MTPTPWGGWNKPENLVPHNNTNCGRRCYLVQRPSDHPFLSQPPPALARVLEGRDWFFTITGSRPAQGGGLDMMMVIIK